MEANIPCPHCHKSFSIQFDQISPGKAHACPNCGATIKFEGQDLCKVQQSIDQADQGARGCVGQGQFQDPRPPPVVEVLEKISRELNKSE